MAIMRMKEIAGLSVDDRAKRLSELRAELARMKTMIRAGGAVENPTRVRELRKGIAKILTVENEQKLKLREAAPEPAKKKVEKKAPEPKKSKEKQAK